MEYTKEMEIGEIPEDEDWEEEEFTISQIVDVYLGGTPKTLVKDYWGGDIFWASAKDVSNCKSRYIEETEKRITQRGVDDSAAKILPKNTLVITSRGTIGKICLLPFPMTFNQTCYGLVAKKNVDPVYLFYKMRSLFKKIDSVSYGTVFATITKKSFDELKIFLPKLNAQKIVSSFLSSLDSKIELNHRMNKTLEAIGQAIFKRWFIDFEFPNEEGKPYKSSGGEMVDGLPKGWRLGSVLELADLLSGGTPKTSVNEYWDGDIPWVSAKDVTNSNGTFILKTERTITEHGLQNSNAKLLPHKTVIITARGTVGNYCILPFEMAINQTNYGIKAKKGIGDYFLFFSIKNTLSQFKQNAYGTVFDTITTRTFQEMRVSLPSSRVIENFEQMVGPLMNKVLANKKESLTLEELRDSLLPKLMSGKIRVKVTG